MEETQKFNEVFQKIELPLETRRLFEKTRIEKIKMSKKTMSMKVQLISEEVIDGVHIDSLSKQLQIAFPFAKDVQICHLFETQISAEQKISLYWNNILHIVEKKSHLCCRILRDSIWEIVENTLFIQVKNNASFICTQRDIDKLIENIIRQNLLENLSVRFKDEFTSQESRDSNLKYMESFFEKQVANITPVISTDITEKKSRSDAPKFTPNKRRSKVSLKIKEKLNGSVTLLSGQLDADNEIFIIGTVFSVDIRTLKSENLLVIFDITDETNSITAKFFISPDDFTDEYKQLIKKGSKIAMRGKLTYDDFTEELSIFPAEIAKAEKSEEKMDLAEEKRVELHLHTQMSQMDAINSATEYIMQAAKWGHKAIAITDHGVVQAFPEAMSAGKKAGIKIIYGVEAYLIDDLTAIVQSPRNQTLGCDFVVFDIETTGLQKEKDFIIEIGAVKVCNGEIIDKYSALIDPKMKLPEKIIELTGITDEMLKGQRDISDVLPEFLEFAGDSVLVAHNASFDVGFIREWSNKFNLVANFTVIDTLALSRVLFPQLKKHKLNVIAEHLGVSLENHHRAVDDANATAEIFLKTVDMIKEHGIETVANINTLANKSEDKKRLQSYHAIILVKNAVGLRNLYELVSNSHIKHFFRRPRIPKSEFLKLREGLIIGTACESGEFYRAVRERQPEERIEELCNFYDYLEIQPIKNNMYLVRDDQVKSVQDLMDINKKIVEYGEIYNKPVVATCDVHFIDAKSEVYRKIIQYSEGYKDSEEQPPLYYRTTEEMLDEFQYLGAEKALEVVVTNTNKISDMCEPIKPIPDETFPPKIEGSEQQLKDITIGQAKEIYGENLPLIVEQRLNRELDSIIKNGFSVMYIIAQKLVWKSMEDGYLVGSRGSVGSSFVATMAGITEVNPLQAHYVCPNCKYSDFDSDEVKSFAGASGCDMPDKNCPECEHSLNKDGHDIPFETFLGFDGDKEPDIDLNFSGEYQAKAHAYTEELFGSDHVFKAGTIGTVADKTAYMYVKKYFEEKEIIARNAEINRLKIGCTGIKRTTGQHPGGLMVVPSEHSIYEFCPIQRPANDVNSTVTTTHFDYHSISGRLLKLDILGHDVPTIIRMLHDTTGIDPRTVDLGDSETLSLFTTPNALGITAEDINCNTGSLGLPEFGTSFVRQMLVDTAPQTFAELVRISGLSHGTDVWFNNAQDLIRDGVATLKEVIPTRDDIMVYLIIKGVEKKSAFKIMENVRKGKGLTPEEVKIMEESNIPDWYIESCRRIKYMFPKGHAVAYVMMTVRIAYFKIHHPYSFYASTFSVKSEDFDYVLMCNGKENVQREISRLYDMGKEASAKEKSSLTILELVLEMYARGLKFVPVDLYKSDALKFKVTDEGLLPPLCSIQGLGLSVANNIVESRKRGDFMTQEDFKDRTKANKTVIELLRVNNLFFGIPETNQLSLF